MNDFKEVEKAILFTAKSSKILPACFEKGWDIVAVKQDAYLELLRQENLDSNILYKSIRIRGTIPCLISTSKKFDLLEQTNIASLGTIAIIPKESLCYKKYIKQADRYVAFYQAYERNEEAREEKASFKEKIKKMEKELSSLKKKQKVLKKQASLNASQADHVRNIGLEITDIETELAKTKLSSPKVLSMIGLSKESGIEDTFGNTEKIYARFWSPLGEYGDFYVFSYNYITMAGFYQDSVKRGKQIFNFLKQKPVLDLLPVKSSIYKAEQNINKEFLEAIKQNDKFFQELESPFIEQSKKEIVPPLLPPSSGNIINLLFSGILNGELETEDMGKVLVKGSTIKKRRLVGNYHVDSLSQELFIFKFTDYAIVQENVV